MAAVETNILLALRSHLIAFARDRSLPIAFTNKAFSAPGDGRYLRESFIPNTVTRRFLGSAEPQRHQGIYQIDVMWPQGDGETVAREIAGAVSDHFATDLRLTSGGVSVIIPKRPEVGGMIIDEARTMIPTTVVWDCWA